VNDELGKGRVEFAIGKRQLFSGCDAYLHSGMALPGCGDELLRRIDCRDRCRSETVDEFGRQRTWTAADVEHPVVGRDSGEVRERLRQPNGVATHEAVVGAGIDGEAHHGLNLSLPQTPAVVPSSTAY
jgi:hypothetical protein